MDVVVWYCDICDKTINFKSKSKHINSNSHKDKEKYGVIVKEYEFIRLDINKVGYMNKNCARDRCIKYFH